MKNLPNTYLVGIITIIYLALAVTFSQLLHFSRALDEGYHLEYITFIKENGRLPITYEERAQITRADFPPLYQLLVSVLSAPVRLEESPRFKVFWDSFRYQAIDHQSDQVWTLNTEDLQWPYLGQFLVWQIGRGISIILSLATVVIVFFTLRDIPPLSQKLWLPLVGAAILAFIPRYIILGSALNDDNLLGPLAALYFWMLVKVVKSPEKWWPFVVMGIALGLSMTVKYTLVVVPVEIIVVCIALAWKQELGWPWMLKRVALTGGLALVSSSWWFGWNIWFLNTVVEDGWVAGIVRPLFAGGTDTTLNRISGAFSGGQVGLTTLPEDTIVGTYPHWARNLFFSFWGVGIADAIPLFPYAYTAIGVMLVIAIFGLWRLWQTESAARKWLLLLIFHLGLFFVLPLIRFELTRRLSVAAQGRHILIPAATAVVALIVWGLVTAIPQRWHLPVFGFVIIGFVGWTGAHLYRFATVPTPPLLPLRTSPQAAEWLPHDVDVQFGDAIELTGYELEPLPQQGQLHLNLSWRSSGIVNESYLLKAMLLNEKGEIVSYWSGYHGDGRLPTLAWEPGDVIFDRLALPLPNLPAGEYTVQVQLDGRAGPLPLNFKSSAQSDEAPDAMLTLASATLHQPAMVKLPNSLVIEAENPIQLDFGVWRAGGPVAKTLPVFRYPATISIVTNQTGLELALVDEREQSWPVASSQAGIHTFIIGPRWPSGQYRLRATVAENESLTTTTEPLLVVENWWPRQFEPPEIAVPSEANFADQINVLGYYLPQKQVEAGQAFPVTVYWQAPPNRPPQADFTQFNHLHSSDGALFGGYDRRPLEYYSALLWAPGEVVVDGYTVPVDADAPPGEYYLDVGYYITVGEAAVNLPLVDNGQMTEASSITIGPIEVVRE